MHKHESPGEGRAALRGHDSAPAGYLPLLACAEPHPHRISRADDCSPDFWNNYEKDIKLVKELGSNCFRFSFEWGKLEPKLGEWDEAAFKRYEEIIMCLLVCATGLRSPA